MFPLLSEADRAEYVITTAVRVDNLYMSSTTSGGVGFSIQVKVFNTLLVVQGVRCLWPPSYNPNPQNLEATNPVYCTEWISDLSESEALGKGHYQYPGVS